MNWDALADMALGLLLLLFAVTIIGLVLSRPDRPHADLPESLTSKKFSPPRKK